MIDNMINVINKLDVPKVILRYIMMNFLDLTTINNLLLTIKEMNVLDNYSKDILVKAKHGFIWNCMHGNLAVAKWLYWSCDINIHANNEDAFTWSCACGHLTIAKWLYSLDKVNIHANYEQAFRSSCW